LTETTCESPVPSTAPNAVNKRQRTDAGPSPGVRRLARGCQPANGSLPWRPKRRKTSHLVLCSASTSKVSQDSRSPGDIGASSKTGGPFPATFSPFANTKPRVGACVHECQRCNSISSDFFQPCPAVAVGADNHTSIAALVSSSESGHRCEYTSSVSVAEAWPRRACTVFTDSPAWINADA
jgi:hypothetical protein